MTLSTKTEQATSGSRELDVEIAVAIGWHRVEPRFTRKKRGGWIAPEDYMGVHGDGSPRLDSLHGTTMHQRPPPFTTSLDAAMTLVPDFGDNQYGERVKVGLWDGNGVHPEHIRATAWVFGAPRVYAATLALALCAAALKAQGL